MKWGLRWGDPHGRCLSGSTGGHLTITKFKAIPAFGPGVYQLEWSIGDLGSRWGFRWGRHWGRPAVWFKVYVNGDLRVTTRDTEARISIADAEDPAVAIVMVGPASSDAAYDPSISLATLPGNRVKLDWTPPTESDLDHFNVYWDNGTGTVSYTTPKASVRADDLAAYDWTSEPLANGTYKYVVRSVDSAGNEDTNTTTATVTIASFPAAPTALAYTYSAVTKKVTLTFTSASNVNVYSDGGTGTIDYATPVATAQASPWVSGTLTGPGTFKYGVRADNLTYEEANLTFIQFEIDASEAAVVRPSSPYNLTVTPAAGGTFVVSGRYDPRRPTVDGVTPAAAANIKIYTDAGDGSVDWVTALATATLSAAGGGSVYRFSYTTGAYAHGLTVLFGARANTSGNVTDENTDTVSGVADTTAPTAPSGLSGSAVRSTEGDG